MTETTSQSLDSIIQQIETYSEMGIDISPYLSAIQSLAGKTPGYKYKELNRAVAEIVGNEQQKIKKRKISLEQRVLPAMTPLLKIRVGVASKSNEAVIEALKSEDIPIVNQALGAKWFFEISNDLLTAEYFTNEIMPHVSKRTRFGLIKALSRGLRRGGIEAEEKSESFHRAFTDLYGEKEALLLLPFCGINYIKSKLLELKLLIPYDVLVDLFQKDPEIAIDCLKRFVRNKCYKKGVVSPPMTKQIFQQFLPRLIRRHVDVFVELYDPRYRLKIGSTNTKLFFEQASQVVVDKAKIFWRLFPIEVIGRKLTQEQFEMFFANLFPDDRNCCQLDRAIKKLKYYPRGKREQLLKRTYEAKYSRELSISDNVDYNWDEYVAVHDEVSAELFEKLFLDNFPSSPKSFQQNNNLRIFNVIKYPSDKTYALLDKASRLKWNGKSLFDDVCSLDVQETHKQTLLKLIPAEKRGIQVAKFLDKCEEKSNEYYDWYVYVPASQSLGFFKDTIAKISDESARYSMITRMIKSCAIDKRNEDLLEFLEYYNRRHKNEKPDILVIVYQHILTEYDFKQLNDKSWYILRELLLRSHTKGELSRKFSLWHVEKFLETAVYRALIKNDERDRAVLDKIFEIALEFNLTKSDGWYNRKWLSFVANNHKLNEKTPMSVWIELKGILKIQRYCFQRLDEMLPQKFPPNHPIWQEMSEYESIKTMTNNASAVVEQIAEFNRSIDELKKYFDPNFDLKKLSVSDYPWLVEFIKEALEGKLRHYYQQELLKLMIKHEPELLKQCRVENDSDDEDDDDNDNKKKSKCAIKTGRAIVNLKNTQTQDIERFDRYLNKCRSRLKLNTKKGGAAARRFLLATKWYQNLPERIITKCLGDVKTEGSLKILGVMLEGEVFGNLIARPLAPSDSAVDVDSADSKDHYALVKVVLPAMNLTCPPVSFDLIILFCQGEYVKLAAQALNCASERVNKAKIESFAERLIDKPVAVKKHGIRLFFKIATKDDLELFVKRLWLSEKHTSIREMITNLVLEMFKSNPNETNWKLVLLSIESLKETDEVPMKLLTSGIGSIENEYTSRYIEALLEKIEEMPDEMKNDWIGDLLSNASCYNNPGKLFTEEFIADLVDKYCFVEPSTATVKLLTGAEDFAKNVFGRLFSNKYYKFSFNVKPN